MTDEEFRGLQERVALIKDLSEHPGWTVAVDRAHAAMYVRQRQILTGSPQNFGEYRETVAWLDGINHFIAIPEMVQKELEVELANREEL